MKITRDRQTDTAYIQVSDKSVAETLEASLDVYFDLDDEGKLVGIELLKASEYLDRDELSITIPSAPLSTPAKPELVFG